MTSVCQEFALVKRKGELSFPPRPDLRWKVKFLHKSFSKEVWNLLKSKWEVINNWLCLQSNNKDKNSEGFTPISLTNQGTYQLICRKDGRSRKGDNKLWIQNLHIGFPSRYLDPEIPMTLATDWLTNWELQGVLKHLSITCNRNQSYISISSDKNCKHYVVPSLIWPANIKLNVFISRNNCLTHLVPMKGGAGECIDRLLQSSNFTTKVAPGGKEGEKYNSKVPRNPSDRSKFHKLILLHSFLHFVRKF